MPAAGGGELGDVRNSLGRLVAGDVAVLAVDLGGDRLVGGLVQVAWIVEGVLLSRFLRRLHRSNYRPKMQSRGSILMLAISEIQQTTYR